LDPVNKDWVIEKLARKIVEFFPEQNRIKLHYFPRQGYAVTHWMHYLNASHDYLKVSTEINTFLVPHIDSKEKEEVFLKNLELGAIPIFMSRQHSEEVSKKLNLANTPIHILPGSDLAGEKQYFNLIIASHVYPDGRKNESFLFHLSRDLSLVDVHFTFVGKGWHLVKEALIDAGASVAWFNPNEPNYPNYNRLIEMMRSHDLFVYLGFDEGSLGALDAYLMGLPLLITNQGFHQQFEERENVILFNNYEDFKKKLTHLLERRKHIKNEKWQWLSYSKQYESLWDDLISNKF
jgi:hypothetical protein